MSRHVPDMEILAHISAPTTRKEDDRYRNEAYAYRNFEAASSVKLVLDIPTPIHRRQPKRPASTVIVSTAAHAVTTSAHAAAPLVSSSFASSAILAGTQPPLDYSTSKAANYTDRDDIVQDTPLRAPYYQQALSEKHGIADSSTVVPASPIGDGTAFRSSATKGVAKDAGKGVKAPGHEVYIDETQLAITALESQFSDYETDLEQDSGIDVAAPEGTNSHSTTQVLIQTAPAVLCTAAEKPPAKEIQRELQPQTLNTQLPSQYSFSYVSSRATAEQGKSRNQPSPQNLKRKAPGEGVDPDSNSARHGALIEISSESSFTNSTNRSPCRKRERLSVTSVEQLPSLNERSPFDNLPLEWQSPPPPTDSMKPWGRFLTRSLKSLEENCLKFYEPGSQQREVTKFDRGCWVVDTSQWTVEVQLSFWESLRLFVTAGKGGSAFWCVRDGKPTQGKQGLGTVELYCWGEVMKHAYLLLCVARKSQEGKGPTAFWRDSGGHVVVQML